jgi:N-carbamoyl-L-amino-acid hydrolase
MRRSYAGAGAGGRPIRALAVLAVFVLTSAALSVCAGSGAVLRVDSGRLNRRIIELAEIGRTADGGVHRPAYGSDDVRAREIVIGWMKQAGLDVRMDAAANIIGRREGSEAGRPALVLGSHLDTVPAGGRFDGAAGVLAAIECLQTIAESGPALRHPIEVVVFTDEEGGTAGSAAMIGELSARALSSDGFIGKTVAEGIAFLGGDPSRLAEAVRRPDSIAAYLELHIEQGGALDAAGIRIGVVEGIVGIRRWTVTVQGMANHAGTTPMGARRDALVAAARFILDVRRVVMSVAGRQVGTVGKIQAEPGAPNVIPGRVTMILELRDLDERVIQSLFDRICEAAMRAGDETGTAFTFAPLGDAAPPALMNARIREAIAAAAESLGLSRMAFPSGAGHDAQNMARLAPAGMIFVPCRGGISHSPREFTSIEDIAAGADVLLRTLIALNGL